jgi:holo-[acyl-carrier protein] synthase
MSRAFDSLCLVVGHGIDVVDVQDYARLLNSQMKPHLRMKFTEQELQECGENERTAERLAGRFAAKEAVLKALGLPFGDGVGFVDIEILNGPTGAPSISTHRLVAQRASELGVEGWLLSTSHTSMVAVASVIGVRFAAAC